MIQSIIDAHHHIWRLSETPWLQGPPVPRIFGAYGLGTFDRACSAERWRPMIEETIDLFGPSRCLFGSNFPIEKLWTSYARLVGTVRECLSRYSQSEQHAVLHDTAARLYGL